MTYGMSCLERVRANGNKHQSLQNVKDLIGVVLSEIGKSENLAEAPVRVEQFRTRADP